MTMVIAIQKIMLILTRIIMTISLILFMILLVKTIMKNYNDSKNDDCESRKK